MKLHKKESFRFDKQAKVGDAGVALVIAHYRILGLNACKATDMQDRWFGIDAYVDNSPIQIKYEHSYRRYRTGTTGRYTGNITFEIISKMETCMIGGHLNTKSKYTIHLMADDILLVLDSKKLKLFLLHNWKDYNGSTNPTNNGEWHSYTILVPFADLTYNNLLIKQEKLRR